MERRQFFPAWYPAEHERVSEALEALAAVEEHDLQVLAQGLPPACDELEAADELAQRTGLSVNQINRIISFTIRLHVASATTHLEMATAIDEIRAAGYDEGIVQVVASFIEHLSDNDAALGVHMGRHEALACGVSQLGQARCACSLRAAFGDAVYQTGDPTPEATDLAQFTPIGILALTPATTGADDVVFQVDRESLEMLMKVLRVAEQRLTVLEAFAAGWEETDET